jgi:hypothetical protein
VHGALSMEEGGTKEFPSWYVYILKIYGVKLSNMAIKKKNALWEGIRYFGFVFIFYSFLVCVFSLFWFKNKVLSFAHLG